MKKGAGSRPPSLRHSWSLTPGEARNLQIGLRAKLRFSPLRRSPRTVAGADISHLRFGRRAVAEVVVFSFPDLERIEESLALGEVAFPYVPGLLSFREGPLLERAFEGLRCRPDLVLFDGQGIASHLGLRLGVPSVGCAKSRLWGEAAEPPDEKGAWSPLREKGGKVVGGLLRTRKGVKPVYISPGPRIDLEGAIRIALASSPRYRIPAPIRAAHIRTNEERRRLGIV
ncbi:MAG TPA: endonuclease V [Nitrospinae bacterium]|nr:endonuclease V [Nitrospinota bacterium]